MLDTVIGLERPKDYESSQGARFNVKFEKNRGFFGDDAKSFECHLCTDEKGQFFWSTKPIEESLYERVIILSDDGLDQKEMAEELGIHKGTVSKYLKRARLEGRLNNKESK